MTLHRVEPDQPDPAVAIDHRRDQHRLDALGDEMVAVRRLGGQIGHRGDVERPPRIAQFGVHPRDRDALQGVLARFDAFGNPFMGIVEGAVLADPDDICPVDAGESAELGKGVFDPFVQVAVGGQQIGDEPRDQGRRPEIARHRAGPSGRPAIQLCPSLPSSVVSTNRKKARRNWRHTQTGSGNGLRSTIRQFG